MDAYIPSDLVYMSDGDHHNRKPRPSTASPNSTSRKANEILGINDPRSLPKQIKRKPTPQDEEKGRQRSFSMKEIKRVLTRKKSKSKKKDKSGHARSISGPVDPPTSNSTDGESDEEGVDSWDLHMRDVEASLEGKETVLSNFGPGFVPVSPRSSPKGMNLEGTDEAGVSHPRHTNDLETSGHDHRSLSPRLGPKSPRPRGINSEVMGEQSTAGLRYPRRNGYHRPPSIASSRAVLETPASENEVACMQSQDYVTEPMQTTAAEESQTSTPSTCSTLGSLHPLCREQELVHPLLRSHGCQSAHDEASRGPALDEYHALLKAKYQAEQRLALLDQEIEKRRSSHERVDTTSPMVDNEAAAVASTLTNEPAYPEGPPPEIPLKSLRRALTRQTEMARYLSPGDRTSDHQAASHPSTSSVDLPSHGTCDTRGTSLFHGSNFYLEQHATPSDRSGSPAIPWRFSALLTGDILTSELDSLFLHPRMPPPIPPLRRSSREWMEKLGSGRTIKRKAVNLEYQPVIDRLPTPAPLVFSRPKSGAGTSVDVRSLRSVSATSNRWSPRESMGEIRPLRWLPRMEPTSEDAVIICIGKNNPPEQIPKRYILPRSKLMEESGYLAQMFGPRTSRNGRNEPFNFPEIEPTVFEVWLKWIFFSEICLSREYKRISTSTDNGLASPNSLTSPPPSAASSTYPTSATAASVKPDSDSDDEITLLLKCHHFGRIFQSPSFQDAITDSIIFLSTSRGQGPPFHLTKKVYNTTTPESGLRRLWKAMLSTEKWPETWDDDKVAAAEMGWAAFSDMGEVMRTKRDEEKEEDWRSGGCRFHEHPVEESGTCTSRRKEWI